MQLSKKKFSFFLRKGDSIMARKANYEEKIATLQAKITKKQEELKNLKAQLEEVKTKKAQQDYKVLVEYMEQNNLTAEDVLGAIKE